MMGAYTRLHNEGYAHSIEVWQKGKLVGGLYGLAIGKAFFGESMFSLVSNASKAALIFLCTFLEEDGFKIIDCQVSNPHLLSMGAVEIDRDIFIQKLKRAISL
jgi:leucyl/phenylalanyl-tRNA--protein transferase